MTTQALLEVAPSARPYDWPGPGPLDLRVHDLPHRSSTLEWWYVNAHLLDSLGRTVSVFASFFQTSLGTDDAGEKVYAHALTWAMVDVEGKKYHSESLVDPDAPAISLERLNRGEGPKEERVRRALREVLEKGRVPAPDTRMQGKAKVDWDRLSLDFDGRTFEKLPDGRYRLRLGHGAAAVGVDLTLSLVKPVIRHGEDGVVSGTGGESMFYYFSPRCAVEGSVMLDGKEAPITSGWAWYDHEFGAGDERETFTKDVAWNWLSAQLDNGCELTIYDLFEQNGTRECGHFAVVIDPHGRRREYHDFRFEGSQVWTSTRTFADYPQRWRVEIPEAGISLDVRAAFANQEFITFISKSAFWEGVVEVTGVMEGAEVRGLGFVERANFGVFDSMDDFFRAVSRETRRSVDRILPAEPGERDVSRLIWGEQHPAWSRGVDVAQYRDAMIRPVRAVVERGGKSWRSYCAVVCCDAVGGDSTYLSSWLAMPELLHVGSLIVDDVQDRSTVRRGGPPAHAIYGEPLAINAGSACYFLPHLFVEATELSDRERLLFYDLFFRAVRSAHAGQGLDLSGLAHAADAAIERGETEALEERVVAVHRLKSAAPASGLAQIGSVLGGGTEAQTHALGYFLQQVGVAFQIVDDVLNLRGFDGDTKSRGEDLTEGKVTMPVARALAILPRDEARELWRAISARPSERAEVERIIGVIEDCGALDACERTARELVEDGWRRVDAVLPDSYYKINLRAFGWYTIDRHY